MVHTAARTATRALSLCTIVTVFGLVACQPATREAVVQPAPGEGMVLTDADIVSIVSTANTGEIQQGQLALQKSRNNAVRQFAQRMITDHTMLQQRTMAVQGALDGARTQNMVARQLETNAQRTVQTLQQLEGAQFDRTYMQSQVEIHQWLLDTLDQALIPSARNRDLERGLVDARDIIASHLQQAQQVRASLGQ